jgi:hypothetical protein
MVRHPFRRRSLVATPRPSRASPTDADYLPGMLCSLPRWSDPCCWLSRWRAPAPGSSGSIPPSPLQRRVGTTLGFSRPARALHALRPAKSLAHLSWTLSRGFGLVGYPTKPLASYRIYHQLFEWVLPPLVICPFRAHAEACPTYRTVRMILISSPTSEEATDGSLREGF